MLTATKPLVGGACAAPSSSARRRTFVVPEARRKPGNGRRTSVSKVGSTSTSTTTTTTTTLSADSNGAAVGTVTRPDVHVQDRTHATEMKATVTVHMSKAAGVRDFLYDLILKTWLHVDLVSSELDPQTGQEREPISGAVKHSGRVDDEWDMYEATFKVPASFGPIGAVQVTNYHHSEMLLGDIEVFPTGQEESAVTFHCKSWIDPSHCTPDKRVFFPAHSYLPSQTPKGVEGLRKRELEILRGTGCGERKEHDRIYDYDVYNDLGNPDDDNNPTTRPVLGGKEHPYPRRCRTGRPRSKKDPFSEERSHKEHIYVPRDEAFTERKMGAFDTKKFMSQLHALTTGLKTAKHKSQSFPSLSAIDQLYDDNFRNQPVQPEGGKLRFVIDLLETELLHLFKLEGAAFLEGIRRVFKFDQTASPRTQGGSTRPHPLMDAASRTWPPPNPSPSPFSSRLRASSDPHRRRRRRHSKKPKPEPPAPPPKNAPVCSGADFASLPPELLHRALSAVGAADVSAASRACRSWRDALQPLREAAALHAHGRRLKHGPAVPAGLDGEGRREAARHSALGLFKRAARLGSAAAMVDAGLMCWEEGRREEAVGYYQAASELGHPVGMCNLGVSYLEADPPQAEEAVRWFYPAASAGNVRAQYNLALCLQNGKGIKRNQREAAKWYLRAAEGGNVRAMYNVSLCYGFGEGFTQDPVRAKKWLQLAADCGHRKALYESGIKLCAAGDKMRSLMYLELATRHGESAASHMRDVILESLSPANAQRALSDAAKWRPKSLSARR